MSNDDQDLYCSPRGPIDAGEMIDEQSYLSDKAVRYAKWAIVSAVVSVIFAIVAIVATIVLG